MKKVVFFLFVAILATNCNTKDQNVDLKTMAKLEFPEDSLTQPKASWKVNKEVDENGNIIRYDSIYSWSSSNYSQEFSMEDHDSLFNAMKARMQRHFSSLENDSLMNSFFSKDFFSEGFPSQFPNMDDLRKRMEAMQEQFFSNKPRYIIPPKPSEENQSNQL